MTNFVLNQKGEEVISERHQKDYKKENYSDNQESKLEKNFTDVSFDDI